MKLIQIPKKKKGEFRTIALPTREDKLKGQYALAALYDKAQKLCDSSVHGFMPGKSPVTNAEQHRCYTFSLSFDLKDFFDTVKLEHVNGKLSKDEKRDLMPDGRAYQGLPTSPIIANLAATDMDKAILKLIEERPITYTRYADDLTFSFDYWENYHLLLNQIPQIVSRCGFQINPNKTHFQDSRFGRRVITGVAVDNELHVPRSFRRKMRAAKHQKNFSSLKGFEEWAKLKKPTNTPNWNQRNFDRLTSAFKLGHVKIQDLPEKEEVKLTDNCILTGDPIYMLGPSNFTTNWTSCLRHPNGGQRKSVLNWVYFKSVRLAALLSDESISIAGFTRRRMKARAYVFDLEGDKLAYGQIYGESSDAKSTLEKTLHSNGIFSAIHNYHGVYLKGFLKRDKIVKLYSPGLFSEWYPEDYKFKIV